MRVRLSISSSQGGGRLLTLLPHIFVLCISVLGNWSVFANKTLDSDFQAIYGDYFRESVTEANVWLIAVLVLGYFGSVAVNAIWRRRKIKYSESNVNVISSARNNFIAYPLILSLIIVVVADWDDLIYRDNYITKSGFLSMMTGALLMLAPLLVPLQKGRISRVLVLSLCCGIAFAKATRIGALIPVTYLVACRIYGMPIGRRMAMALGMLSMFLYGSALFSRELNSHGFVPYIDNLMANPSSIVQMLENIVSNFSSNYINLLATVQQNSRDFSLDYLWIIFDPRGGEAVGWNDISYRYRLHFAVPYSGYGELINISYLASIIFISAALCWYTLLCNFASSRRGLRKVIVVLAQGAVALFFVLMFSYNARSAVRWFELSIFLFLISFLLVPIRWNRGGK